jgi:site-specific recombinase XerD
MNHTSRLKLSQLILHIDGAYAPSTLRAYLADMTEFITYCDQHKHLALPADPEVIASFLLGSAQTGIKSSTIRRKVGSISAVHRLSNLNDPTKHPEVKLALRKIHRQLGRRFDQAYPITQNVLDQLLAVCGNDLRGKRNRALLLCAYDSMRRRSELVALRIEDIEWGSGSSISILLRKSKTDQQSSGQWIHLGEQASIAIKLWLESSKITEGFIFRGLSQQQGINPELCDGQVGRIFKSLARKAKLGKHIIAGISGHSMRVGSAQDLLIKGASLPQIMVKGGWVKTDTVMRYVERVQTPF